MEWSRSSQCSTQFIHGWYRQAVVRRSSITCSRRDQVLLSHNASVRRRFERILAARGVRVHHGSGVVEVARGVFRTADGRTHEIDETLWTTQAAAAPWLAQSGLAVDTDGFVQVARTLRSISHGDVFAAGDIAAMVDDPRPKSGVFASASGAAACAKPATCVARRAARGVLPSAAVFCRSSRPAIGTPWRHVDRSPSKARGCGDGRTGSTAASCGSSRTSPGSGNHQVRLPIAFLEHCLHRTLDAPVHVVVRRHAKTE